VPLLLDSSVVIELLRERPGAVARLRRVYETREVPFICAVVADEVHRGLRTEELGRATAMLAGFRVAPLGEMEGALSGTWRREAARRGVTLSQSDCLIAAAAVGVHATVATGNPKDFPMDGVSVEHWPVGA
jgi:predicted nucleic acid-binding protein